MNRPTRLIAAALLLPLALVVAPPARAATLDVQGATLTWDESRFFAPVGCSMYTFAWSNNSGRTLRILEMSMRSQYGDSIAHEAEISVENGANGTFDEQICAHNLDSDMAPYTVYFKVQDSSDSSWTSSGTVVLKERGARCISRKTFEVKRFAGACPKGWVRI